jgi:hypothetical protein
MKAATHTLLWVCLGLFAVALLVHFAREQLDPEANEGRYGTETGMAIESQRATDGDAGSADFLKEDFLISSASDLKFGMQQDDFVDLRGSRVRAFNLDAGEEPERPPRIFSEQVDDNSHQRLVVYGFAGEPPVLTSLFYTDSYSDEAIDQELENKLRSATKAWGLPEEFYAEDNAGVDYFVVLWRATDDRFAIAISYAPPAARAANPKPAPAIARYPIITRYFPNDQSLEQTLIVLPNPQSFTVGSMREEFLGKARVWSER